MGAKPPAPTEPPAAPTETVPVETTKPVDEGPYKLAKGKVEFDEKGWPTSGYEYDLPFCESDDTITYWTVCWTPQYLPEEGLGAISTRVREKEMTGVNVEYITISSASRKENFSVLLASDDLPDVMNGVFSYYPGTKMEAIEDGFIANVWDYREYAPNYFWFIRDHMDEDPNLYDSCFADDGVAAVMSQFPTIINTPSTPFAVRADWCRDLGIDPKADLYTIDDLEELAMLMKVEKGAEYPYGLLAKTLDWDTVYACYDFKAYISPDNITWFQNSAIVVDGKVELGYTNDKAKAFLERACKWYTGGYVHPDLIDITDDASDTRNANGETGIIMTAWTSIDKSNEKNADPDCDWQVIRKPVLYKDQVIHIGRPSGYGGSYGYSALSAKSDNLPLAVSWCDWRYTEPGSFLMSYGLQGETWEYDANGKITTTDWAYNHPEGWSWNFVMCVYAMNYLAEHGIKKTESIYMFPGGDVVFERMDNALDYKGDYAYDMPKGVSMTAEQSAEFFGYLDIATYITEHAFEFVYGDKPFSEWGSFIEGLKSMGVDEATAVYQEAYDDYLAKVAKREV